MKLVAVAVAVLAVAAPASAKLPPSVVGLARAMRSSGHVKPPNYALLFRHLCEVVWATPKCR